MTQLTTKTAKRLKELKEFGNLYEADIQAKTIIFVENELKELFLFSEYPSSCCTKCDEMHRFIREIESVENDTKNI